MKEIKILNLKDIRFKPKFNINHGTSLFSISDILKHPEDYIIDYDVFLPTKNKNLQRPFCWTLLQKQELILSRLKGIELPVIVIIQSRDDYSQTMTRTYKIIDGKQRLSTLISYVKGEFPIIWNNEKYFYNDLSQDAKFEIQHYWIKADVGYEYPDALISDDDKIAWFEMINFAGTPQDIEHLNNLKS